MSYEIKFSVTPILISLLSLISRVGNTKLSDVEIMYLTHLYLGQNFCLYVSVLRHLQIKT